MPARPPRAPESSTASGRSRPDPAAAAGEKRSAAIAPGARLAANQLRRMRRIVDAAVDLAEKGGFEAVRLRDVADRSDVALGTLYKYFRSKEDILLFALNEEMDVLEQAMAARPSTDGIALERAVEFFRRATRAIARRPQLARAMIRAMAAGDSDTVMKLAFLQLRIARLVVATLRGEAPDLGKPLDSPAGTATEQAIAQVLMNVWFSSLVGWAAGLHPERVVTDHIRTGAELMLAAPGAAR